MKSLPHQPLHHTSSSHGPRSTHLSHIPPVTTYFRIAESKHRARQLLTYAIGEAHALLSHFVSECYDIVPTHLLFDRNEVLRGRGNDQASSSERPPPATSVFSHLLCVVFLKMSAEEEGEGKSKGHTGNNFRMWLTDDETRQKDMLLALCSWCQQSVFLEEKEEGRQQSESEAPTSSASLSSSEGAQTEGDQSNSGCETSQSSYSSHHTESGGDTSDDDDDDSNSSSSTRPYRALFSKTRRRGRPFNHKETEDTTLLSHGGHENNLKGKKLSNTCEPTAEKKRHSKNNSSHNVKKGRREKGGPPLRSVADNLSLALSHRFIVHLTKLFATKEKEGQQKDTAAIAAKRQNMKKNKNTTTLASSLLDEVLYQYIRTEIEDCSSSDHLAATAFLSTERVATRLAVSTKGVTQGDNHQHSLREESRSASHDQNIAQEALKLLSDALAFESSAAAAHFLARHVLLPIVHRRSCELRGAFQTWRYQFKEARRQRLVSSFGAWKTYALDQYVVEERRRAELFLAGCVAALRRRRVKLRHQHASDRRLMRAYFDCWRYEGVPICLFERRSRQRTMQNVIDAMKFKRVAVMADRYHVMTLGKVALARWHEKLHGAHANRTLLHKCLRKMIDSVKVKRFKREKVVRKTFDFMRNRTMASRFRNEKERSRMVMIYLSDVSSLPRLIAGDGKAIAHTHTQSQQLVVGGTTNGEVHARALGVQGPRSPTFSNVLTLSASRPSNLKHALLLHHTHRNASTVSCGEDAVNVKKALILSKWRRELDKRIAQKKDANRLSRLVHNTLSMRLEEREKISIAKKNSDRLQLLGVIRKWLRAALSDVPRERRLTKTCEAFIAFNCFSKWQERLRKRRERREAEVLCERYSCQSLKGKLFRKWQRRLWAERATRAYHTQREFHTKIACLFAWQKRYAAVSVERKKSEEVAEILSEKLALKHALQTWRVTLGTRRRLLFPVEYATDEAAQVEDASTRLLKGFAFGGDKVLNKESDAHSDLGLNRSNIISFGRGAGHQHNNSGFLNETSPNGFKTEVIISDADLMAGGPLRRAIFFATPPSQSASFHSRRDTSSKKFSGGSRGGGREGGVAPVNPPALSGLCSLRDADKMYLRRLALKAVVCWVAALRLQKYRQAKKQRRTRGKGASAELKVVPRSLNLPAQRIQEKAGDDVSILVHGRREKDADSFFHQHGGSGVSRTTSLNLQQKQREVEESGRSRASTGVAAAAVATAADGYRVVHVDGAKATPFSLLGALKFRNESQRRRHHEVLFPRKEEKGGILNTHDHSRDTNSDYAHRTRSETFGGGEESSGSDGRQRDWESENVSHEGGEEAVYTRGRNSDHYYSGGDDEYYDEDASNAGGYYTTTNASIIDVEVV